MFLSDPLGIALCDASPGCLFSANPSALDPAFGRPESRVLCRFSEGQHTYLRLGLCPNVAETNGMAYQIENSRSFQMLLYVLRVKSLFVTFQENLDEVPNPQGFYRVVVLFRNFV